MRHVLPGNLEEKSVSKRLSRILDLLACGLMSYRNPRTFSQVMYSSSKSPTLPSGAVRPPQYETKDLILPPARWLERRINGQFRNQAENGQIFLKLRGARQDLDQFHS